MNEYYKYGICTLEVKGLDVKNRIIEVYFASFGTIDADNDVFERGAFAKSIREWGPESTKPRIKHLYNHWDAVGEIKELVEDNKGLRAVSKLGRHRLGSDVLLMYDDGIITEHSVGFETIGEDKSGESRIIKEAKLWEGSSLDKWGANMNTPVVKSVDQRNMYIERLGRLNNALQKGNYSDEIFELFEIQIKQIQQVLAGLDALERAGTTPFGAGETVIGQHSESILSVIKSKLK